MREFTVELARHIGRQFDPGLFGGKFGGKFGGVASLIFPENARAVTVSLGGNTVEELDVIEGDTEPILFRFVDPDDGSALPLEGNVSSVRLRMRNTFVKPSEPLVFTKVLDSTKVIDTNGVLFEPIVADWAIGDHRLEFFFTFIAGHKSHSKRRGWIFVRVQEEVK